MKRFFKAFTLAEVLITITIIGVVAALTLPVLIENIDDRILETQNKKAKAVLANGIKLLTAQTNSPYIKDTQLKRCGDNPECIATEMKKVFKITEDSITSPDTFNIDYFMDEDTDKSFKAWDSREGIVYAFRTSDGAMYGILNNAKPRDSLIVVSDANGAKAPNIGEKDLCVLIFDETAQLATDGATCSMSTKPPMGNCNANNLGACNESQCPRIPSYNSGSAWCHYLWNGNSCVQKCVKFLNSK